MIFCKICRLDLGKTVTSVMLFVVRMPATSCAADNSLGDLKPGTTNCGAYIKRGRYLVQVIGCNYWHTAGYIQAKEKILEKNDCLVIV